MIHISIILIIVYICLIVYISNRIFEDYCLQNDLTIEKIEKSFKKFTVQKEALFKTKIDLENEAMEIFTLYEITKDITHSLTEESAFEIFLKKLKEHISFEECILLDPVSPEIKKYDQMQEYFIFTLKGKSKKIGVLVIKGLEESDYENAMILSHQFSLALNRVKLYQEIEQIAIMDSLTKVHTRRYLLERLKEEIERSKKHKIKMSLLMIDADYFKKFNDEYGHLTGDQILREIGYMISESIREIDIAGRYGGEEFCIVLPDTDKAGALLAGERIRSSISKDSIKVYDAVINATVSIGVATFPDDSKSGATLIDKADWALYKAKKQGRNKVCSFGSSDD